jgi:L-idonate 5-dehydrogenase
MPASARSPSPPRRTCRSAKLDIRGTFRFDAEFELAVDLSSHGRMAVKPAPTATVPFANPREAVEIAGDRSRAAKKQREFA